MSDDENGQEKYTVYFSAPNEYNSDELNGQITRLWNEIVLAANPITTGKTSGYEDSRLKLGDGNTAVSIWARESELLTAVFNDVFQARNIAQELVRKNEAEISARNDRAGGKQCAGKNIASG